MLIFILYVLAGASLFWSLYNWLLIKDQRDTIEHLSSAVANLIKTSQELVNLYESISQSQTLYTKGFTMLAENQREAAKDLETLKSQVGERVFHRRRTHGRPSSF